MTGLCNLRQAPFPAWTPTFFTTHERFGSDGLKLGPAILCFYELKIQVCFQKEQECCKVISSSKKTNLFLPLPQGFWRHLGAGFQAPNLARFRDHRSLSLLGRKGLSRSVMTRLSLTGWKSAILVSAHTRAPPLTGATEETRGRGHFRNQPVRRDVLF